MRIKLITLAVIAGFLIAAVPALAQDNTSSYTSTTPTVTTPTTPVKTTETSAVAPASDSGGSGSSQLAKTGGGNTWLLIGIGGALALGSALLLARERRPRSNR